MISENIERILRSVYEKLDGLLEMDRFYVALYDVQRGRLEFPLVEPPEDWTQPIVRSFRSTGRRWSRYCGRIG